MPATSAGMTAESDPISSGHAPNSASSRPPPLAGRQGGCSELQLIGNRHVVVEQMLVVLGAGFLVHGHLDPREIVDCGPGLIERLRILNPESHLQRLAVV